MSYFNPYTQSKCYICGTIGDRSQFINAYFRDLDQEYIEYPEYIIQDACKNMDCHFPQNNFNWEGRKGYNGYWSNEYRPRFAQQSDTVEWIYIPIDKNQQQVLNLKNRGIELINQ